MISCTNILFILNGVVLLVRFCYSTRTSYCRPGSRHTFGLHNPASTRTKATSFALPVHGTTAHHTSRGRRRRSKRHHPRSKSRHFTTKTGWWTSHKAKKLASSLTNLLRPDRSATVQIEHGDLGAECSTVKRRCR